MGVDRKQRRRNRRRLHHIDVAAGGGRKLSFSAQKTMRVAQQLYEGVDIGEGAVGLITYMRYRLPQSRSGSIGQIRETIVQLYGKEGLAEEPRIYKTKSKNAQKLTRRFAHRGQYLPNDIEKHLRGGSISPVFLDFGSARWRVRWARRYSNTVAVELLAGSDGPKRTVLRANGFDSGEAGLHFGLPGRNRRRRSDDSDHVLPPMQEGDRVETDGGGSTQHFTEPPRASPKHRWSGLEEYGIGRPRPMRRSSRHCATASTWDIESRASRRRISARSSADS